MHAYHEVSCFYELTSHLEYCHVNYIHGITEIVCEEPIFSIIIHLNRERHSGRDRESIVQERQSYQNLIQQINAV